MRTSRTTRPSLRVVRPCERCGLDPCACGYIAKLRPDWHSPDDTQGAVKVVMTGSASDPTEWQLHIGSKARRDLLAKRAKDPSDPLKLVIVRDMWLTGFDAPCTLHAYDVRG